jgi:hypothetical protein
MTSAESLEIEAILVQAAVADAPEITADQCVEIRRVLKPYLEVSRAVGKQSSKAAAVAA